MRSASWRGALPREVRLELREALRDEPRALMEAVARLGTARQAMIAAGTAEDFDRAEVEAAAEEYRGQQTARQRKAIMGYKDIEIGAVCDKRQWYCMQRNGRGREWNASEATRRQNRERRTARQCGTRAHVLLASVLHDEGFYHSPVGSLRREGWAGGVH
ncbi:MAG: periplasmic heavy metal sensor [Rhizobiales bacterium]|nr:periplasmic heavy metal sensor [Hyphomicrobiales bacterium]